MRKRELSVGCLITVMVPVIVLIGFWQGLNVISNGDFKHDPIRFIIGIVFGCLAIGVCLLFPWTRALVALNCFAAGIAFILNSFSPFNVFGFIGAAFLIGIAVALSKTLSDD